MRSKLGLAAATAALVLWGCSTNSGSSTGGSSTGSSSGGSSTGGSGTTGASTGGSTGASSTGSSSGASSTGGSAGSAPLCDGGASCAALTLERSPIVTVTDTATDPPAGAGGTPAVGVYYLTAETIYTGLGGASGDAGLTDQQTLAFTGINGASGTVQQAQVNAGDGGIASCFQSSTLTVTFSGTNVTITQSCPTCPTGQNCGGNGSYSATSGPPATFFLLTQDHGQETGKTFTWQHH